MRLNEGVFYRKYGDIVYCRCTISRKDYIFNSISYDVFEYLRNHPDCDLDAICQNISELYEVESYQEFVKGIEEFCEELASEGLINTQQSRNENNEEIRDEAKLMAKQNDNLFTAILEITYRCNEKCIHCYVDDQPDAGNELSLDEYRNILDQLYNQGCMNILLTGGEVCLRNDFLDITEYAVKKGFCVDVYSNGLQLTMDMVIRLSELHVNSVSFSLYSADEKCHDKITCIPGSFSKSLNSIILCKAFDIDTYIKTVVINQNYDGIDELFSFAKRIDVPIVVSAIISSSHKGKSANEFRLLDVDKYSHICKLVLESSNKEEKKNAANGVDASICGIGRNTISIDPYGNVYPCNAFRILLGNTRKKTISEILCDTTFFDDFEKKSFLDICDKSGRCEHSKWCRVCLGTLYAENGSCTPIDDTCMYAKGLHKASIDVQTIK